MRCPRKSGPLYTLLFRSESDSLDFKSAQYRFYGADDEDKSELLKDILALANSWKSGVAYILVGVAENPGSRATITGLTEHLLDSDIQQFVNSKTNRRVDFLIERVPVEGLEIDVITIAERQQRPLFLLKNFGVLKKDAVYIRHGSATVIAGPDEIAAMGATRSAGRVDLPSVEMEFAVPEARKRLGRSINIVSHQLVDAPPPPPRPAHEKIRGLGPMEQAALLYSYPMRSSSESIGSMFRPSLEEVKRYYKARWLLTRFGFWLHNPTGVTAQGVHVEIVTAAQNGLLIRDEWRRPKWPKSGLDRIADRVATVNSDISVVKRGSHIEIVVDAGTLQPKAQYWTDPGLYLGALESISISLDAKIFADNLPQPVEVVLSAQITTEDRVFDPSPAELAGDNEWG